MQVVCDEVGSFRNCSVCGQFFKFIQRYNSLDQLCHDCESEDDDFYDEFCGYEFYRPLKIEENCDRNF